jgi:hypothetical protein
MDLESVATIVGIFAAIVGAVYTTIEIVQALRKEGTSIRLVATQVFTHWRDILIILLATGLGWTYFSRRALLGEPPNVQLTTKAWDAFHKRLFDLAMSDAEDCIANFEGDANSSEYNLQISHAPLPQLGPVSDKERDAYLKRGPLNDVATSYYIRGCAAEALKNTDIAIESYRNAARYTYAVTWDPFRHEFWSPAKVSVIRLSTLQAVKGAIALEECPQ